MNFWRRNWYYIGGILFVVLAFFMGFWGSEHLERIQVILVFSWMAMLVHQFEEYGWPGGFPSIVNIMQFKEKQIPDRYPFNQNLCFVDNVFTTYTFYIVPIFFPNLIWLALAQTFAALIQVPAHGILVNIRLKSFYNPGLAATVFLQLPIAVYMIWYVTANNLATGMDFVFGIIGGIAGYALCFGVPVMLMRSRNTKYPFAPEEIYGYKKEEILAMHQKISKEG
ncbi:MAG: HXXEE domain-containing protein [Candidatus Pelethousia sp.]|nr:HXXEE domain-containing protein [Candidatus Pelethousia sp.]